MAVGPERKQCQYLFQPDSWRDAPQRVPTEEGDPQGYVEDVHPGEVRWRRTFGEVTTGTPDRANGKL